MEMEAYLRRVVTVLAGDIGIRSFQNRDSLKKTADYLTGELSSFGYETERQPFLFRGHTYENLIAERRGESSPEKILIIGAHYDTVRTTYGADDNASGIAGLLGLARGLAGSRLSKTVRFAAFGLEEPPVYRTRSMGSYHYARGLYQKREQIEGMICLEMIGYFSDREGSQQYPLPFMSLKFPSAGNFIALVGNLRSRRFTRGMAKNFRKNTGLPVVTLNAPSIVIGIDFSDHWSFGKFGYHAFMVTDTAFYRNPNYHAPTDLPGTLDYVRMEKVVEGLRGAVKQWGSDGNG